MNRPLRFFSLALCLFFISSSCLVAARKPKWIRGTDPAYPEKQYVVGVGIGKDLESARANARAEVSKVFEARVQQTVTDVQSESFETKGSKKGPAIGSQESEMKTKVATESMLQGVRIADTYYWKRKKKHYALAVLDKNKIRRTLSAQISDKEESIKTLAAQARGAKLPIDRARAYNQAYQTSVEKDRLVAQRRVVDPAPVPDLSDGLHSVGLQKKLREALADIQIAVEAEGGKGSRLKQSVTEKITELGFKVVPLSEELASSPENPVLVTKTKLLLEPLDRGHPNWKFYQWNGTFELVEASANGKTLSSSAPTGSEGHLTDTAAKKKAREAGEKALASEVKDKLSNYIFGN